MSEEKKGMFEGVTAKDWIIGFFTGFLWIFYKMYKNGAPFGKIIGGFVGVIVIIGILGAIFGEKKPSPTNNEVTQKEVKTEIVDNSKAEAERLAKEEEAKKEAEAEKLAKVEAEKNKPLKMQFTIKSTSKQILPIKSTDSSYRQQMINDMNRNAKVLTSMTDYYIDYKDRNLFISDKSYNNQKTFWDKEYQIDVSKIKHIVISKYSTKDGMKGNIKTFEDSYSLKMYGFYDKYDDKYSFSNNKIINFIKFKSLEELNKLKNKLLLVNDSIKVHYEKDFTKKVFITKNSALCESDAALKIAQISDRTTFDRLIKKGKCIHSNEVSKEGFIENNPNTIFKDLVMVKVLKYDTPLYLWVSKDELR